MKLYPTRFSGYYVTEDGEIWTEWYRYSARKGAPRKMSQNQRGGTNKDDRYLSISISLKDENNKTTKQIKYYSHRLIAETLLSNPNNFKEIDHIDRNKKNNSISNLRWCNREINMNWSTEKNAKYFKLTDITTNKVYEGENLQKFIRDNWNWISKRTKIADVRTFTRNLIGKHKKQSHVNGFILKR
jgi:hypothetical protein